VWKEPVAPNRLEQDFTASAPNQKWVSDITYLWTNEGWLYLSVVLDLYSRATALMGARLSVKTTVYHGPTSGRS
jgi:putative transposase